MMVSKRTLILSDTYNNIFIMNENHTCNSKDVHFEIKNKCFYPFSIFSCIYKRDNSFLMFVYLKDAMTC